MKKQRANEKAPGAATPKASSKHTNVREGGIMDTTMDPVPQQYNALSSIVRLNGETPTTTSLIIAEQFGKQHRHVIRAIRSILANPDYTETGGLPNFAQSSYYNEQGKKQPCYHVTRDGFTLLAMGFTGREAMRFKLRFIEAFNHLEQSVHAMHHRETARLRHALVTREPRWSALARYHTMGLMQFEIAKLMGVSRETVRKERYAMESLGLLPPSIETQQLSLLTGGDA
ncbi:Rha family transcriptional regulator [Vreelandella hamiltonii]|uniref:Rha family transcriptional regulator n=1 Tax=Vreelandella hamiltonii TaxID=502829 RepID=A0A8H9I4B3_9GAMM|nr:Rha family transcriptional regulator [Halomonas hamiltonii]GGW23734.1 hypothetical protein GCM10007157_13870 [Halomonas hamiltonii]